MGPAVVTSASAARHISAQKSLQIMFIDNLWLDFTIYLLCYDMSALQINITLIFYHEQTAALQRSPGTTFLGWGSQYGYNPAL